MKISIVTATFNSAQTVRDTMESVLGQTWQDWEHIIVDGGSKDETMAIVRELEPLYKGRLRYVSERDKGIYDAMNKGIAMASGEVVGILNSDDFYTFDKALETIAAEFDASASGAAAQKETSFASLDAVYGDVHYVDPEDLSTPVRYYSSKVFKRSRMRMGFMPAHPTFYCRKAVYERYGTFDLDFKVAADFENLLRLIYVGGIKTKYIPQDFVTMRTGGASSSGYSSHRQIQRDQARAFRKNGVKSNIFLQGLRYLYKIYELVFIS